MMISHDLHTLFQLIIVGGYITLMLYSYFRKRDYMSLSQKILMPLVMVGFILINSIIYANINFEGLSFFILILYTTQIAVQLLLAFSFNQREKKIDELDNLELSLDVFIKIANNSAKAIWVVDYNTHVMIYSNPIYNERYKDYTGDIIENNWTRDKAEIFIENNKKAKEANGLVLEFREPTINNNYEDFKKFFAVINHRDSIVGMEK